ncbi:MAG: D-sedoheptulose-7-phosphate isomerase [Fimbriimonas sp.]
MRDGLQSALADAERLLREFREDPATLDAMTRIAEAIAEAFRQGRKLLVCGNGGSLTDAMHVAEEFSGRFRRDRRPYPALALSDPAHMSCVANDYGFEFVFSRQVEALCGKGDILLVMTTSGNSPNILRAAEAARDREVTVIGCLGRGGGAVAPLCDIILHAPGEGSDRIQELHMLAMHAVIEATEIALGH